MLLVHKRAPCFNAVAFFNLKNASMDALIDLINDIKTAREAGATDAELATARETQRKASFYSDFVMSDNFMGFHAPDEEHRVLGDVNNFGAPLW